MRFKLQKYCRRGDFGGYDFRPCTSWYNWLSLHPALEETSLLCIKSHSFYFQVVLSAILPHYLEYLRTDGSSLDYEEKLKGELTGLSSLVTSINVLIKSSEVLTRLVRSEK